MFIAVPDHARPGRPWATPALALALIGGFIVVWAPSDAVTGRLLNEWATLPANLFSAARQGPAALVHPALRLLTSQFLHANWAHLLGNLVFLLIFGMPAERKLGSLRLLVLFLLGGAVANLATALTIDNPTRLIIGASGAVSAVIGTYLALFPRARLGVVIPLGLFLEFVRAPASLLIGIWALLQVGFAYIGPAFGETAWVAHLAGFVFGLAFAFLQRGAVARRLRRQSGY